MHKEIGVAQTVLDTSDVLLMAMCESLIPKSHGNMGFGKCGCGVNTLAETMVD